MGFSALFAYSLKGDLLISRIYRGDVGRSISDTFRVHVLSSKDVRSPMQTISGTTFFHVRCDNVYLVAVSKENANAAMVFELLNKLIEVFSSYFGAFNEESVRANFVLIYELLEEMVDHGYPQATDADALKLAITQGKMKKGESSATRAKQMTTQVTGAIPWRQPGIKYKKEEVYLDVVESVNLLVSPQGNLLSADVTGNIIMRSTLSGMPEARIGLNDKIVLEKESRERNIVRPPHRQGIAIDDITFHQCVRLGKFDSERVISFVPPDGEFTLMKYRSTDKISQPFRVLPQVRDISASRMEYTVTVKSNFSYDKFGQNVIVRIPVPKNTAVCKVRVQAGKAKYVAGEEAIVWKIRRFPGEMETTLNAFVETLASVSGQDRKKAWARPPIAMTFSVPMETASGLRVRFLKVVENKLGYTSVKWVRYITQAGAYQTRF